MYQDFRSVLVIVAIAIVAPNVHAQDARSDREPWSLDQQVSFVFEDIHISDVTRFISRQIHRQILIDKRVVAPAKGEVQSATNAEYVTDGFIKYVNLENVSVDQALEAILKPLGLTYSVEGGFIWISTPENMKHATFEQLETRVYDLPGTELPDKNSSVQQGTRAEVDLIAVLERATPTIIDPLNRETLSSLLFNSETNQLTVHNTPTNLRKLEALLDLLLDNADQD